MDTKETFEKIQYQFIIITFNDEEEKERALTFKGNPQFSSVLSNSLRSNESQHVRPPCPSPTPGVDSDSRPSSQ